MPIVDAAAELRDHQIFFASAGPGNPEQMFSQQLEMANDIVTKELGNDPARPTILIHGQSDLILMMPVLERLWSNGNTDLYSVDPGKTASPFYDGDHHPLSQINTLKSSDNRVHLTGEGTLLKDHLLKEVNSGQIFAVKFNAVSPRNAAILQLFNAVCSPGKNNSLSGIEHIIPKNIPGQPALVDLPKQRENMIIFISRTIGEISQKAYHPKEANFENEALMETETLQKLGFQKIDQAVTFISFLTAIVKGEVGPSSTSFTPSHLVNTANTPIDSGLEKIKSRILIGEFNPKAENPPELIRPELLATVRPKSRFDRKTPAKKPKDRLIEFTKTRLPLEESPSESESKPKEEKRRSYPTSDETKLLTAFGFSKKIASIAREISNQEPEAQQKILARYFPTHGLLRHLISTIVQNKSVLLESFQHYPGPYGKSFQESAIDFLKRRPTPSGLTLPDLSNPVTLHNQLRKMNAEIEGAMGRIR